MAIYCRPSGIYYVQFAYQNKNYIKSSNSRNRQDAVELEQQMRADLINNKNRIKLTEAIAQYLEANKNATRYKNLASIGKWYIDNTADIYLDELDLSILKTKQVSVGTLNQYIIFINQLNKLGYTPANIKIKTARPDNKQLRYLSKQEEDRILAKLKPAEHDLVILLLDTGARLNEILSLEDHQIDLVNRTISLWRSKVKNESLLYMTPRVFEILSNGSDFRNANIQHLRTVLPVRIHDLRHTCASRLVQNGLSIQETQIILGHSDIQSTLRYAHLDQRRVMQKAMNILSSG